MKETEEVLVVVVFGVEENSDNSFLLPANSTVSGPKNSEGAKRVLFFAVEILETFEFVEVFETLGYERLFIPFGKQMVS